MSLEINSHFYHQLISMMKVMFFSKLIDEILSTCQKTKTKLKNLDACLISFTKLTLKNQHKMDQECKHKA